MKLNNNLNKLSSSNKRYFHKIIIDTDKLMISGQQHIVYKQYWLTDILCPCLEYFGLIELNIDYYKHLLQSIDISKTKNTIIVSGASWLKKIIINKSDSNSYEYKLSEDKLLVDEIILNISNNYVDYSINIITEVYKKFINDSDYSSEQKRISEIILNKLLTNGYLSIYDISSNDLYFNDFKKSTYNLFINENYDTFIKKDKISVNFLNKFIFDHLSLFNERYIELLFKHKYNHTIFNAYYLLIKCFLNIINKNIDISDDLNIFIEKYIDDYIYISNDLKHSKKDFDLFKCIIQNHLYKLEPYL